METSWLLGVALGLLAALAALYAVAFQGRRPAHPGPGPGASERRRRTRDHEGEGGDHADV